MANPKQLVTYELSGAPLAKAEKVIIFVHGWPDGPFQFHDIQAYLQELHPGKYAFLSLILPHFEYTEQAWEKKNWPLLLPMGPNKIVELLQQTIADVVDAQTPKILIGHDWGGLFVHLLEEKMNVPGKTNYFERVVIMDVTASGISPLPTALIGSAVYQGLNVFGYWLPFAILKSISRTLGCFLLDPFEEQILGSRHLSWALDRFICGPFEFFSNRLFCLEMKLFQHPGFMPFSWLTLLLYGPNVKGKTEHPLMHPWINARLAAIYTGLYIELLGMDWSIRDVPNCPTCYLYAGDKPFHFQTDLWLDGVRTKKGNVVKSFTGMHWFYLFKRNQAEVHRVIGDFLSPSWNNRLGQ